MSQDSSTPTAIPTETRDTITLQRRSLLKGLMLTPLMLCIAQARTEAAIAAPSSQQNETQDETYHLFIPTALAQKGGQQSFTSITGQQKQIRVPAHCQDGSLVKLKRQGLNRSDIAVTLHTLDDGQAKTSRQIGSLIDFQALHLGSQLRCRMVYQSLCDGQPIEDLSALALLDFLVAASALKATTKEQYQIASFNARIMSLEDCLERSLQASQLKNTEKQSIRSAAVCVRSSRPVFDLAALSKLDAIIQGSDLPTSLKQQYAFASSTSRMLTADVVLLDLIQRVGGDRTPILIETYQQVRDGQPASEPALVDELDALIHQSGISPEIELVYALARNKTLEQLQPDEADLDELLEMAGETYKIAQHIVPVSQTIMGTIGATTTTGVSVSSLAGAAGTNATLSVLGGGVGMLGGVGVVTGGAALLGAASLLMVIHVSQLDHDQQMQLGIAAATGIAGSAAVVASAWSLVGAYGVASTGTAISSLSGAAAYSATMSVLGGTSFLTGGAALLAFGMGYGMWLLLQSHSSHQAPSQKERAQTLDQLELLLYTVQEDLTSPLVANHYAVAPQIHQSLSPLEDQTLTLAPRIPTNQLQSILERYAIAPDEIILACNESYGLGFGDRYEGFVLSDRRLFWKRPGIEPQVVSYGEADYILKIQTLLDFERIRHETSLYQLLMGFAEVA